MSRFERNIGTITQEEQDILATKNVCVVGCGGLGGYAIEMLVRLGIGKLTVIDGDTFSENNLNRQIYARVDLIGASKVLETAKRCKLINPGCKVTPQKAFINASNATSLLDHHDIVIDALDNASSRLILEHACEKLNIVLIHAAVREWNARICTIYPGDRTLTKLYNSDGGFPTPSVPSFVPAFAASIEVSEATKFLLGRGEVLRNKILTVNLLDNQFSYT